jgi:hypothetical protein
MYTSHKQHVKEVIYQRCKTYTSLFLATPVTHKRYHVIHFTRQNGMLPLWGEAIRKLTSNCNKWGSFWGLDYITALKLPPHTLTSFIFKQLTLNIILKQNVNTVLILNPEVHLITMNNRLQFHTHTKKKIRLSYWTNWSMMFSKIITVYSHATSRGKHPSGNGVYLLFHFKVKSKAISVTGRGGL